MKHVFIINPIAGKGDKYPDYIKRIHDAFKNRTDEYEIVLTEYRKHAIKIARTYAESGESVRLYAFGGDGTVNEVVTGAYGYDNVEIAAYPAGTGNDFVKVMGDIDWNNLENLIDGECKTIDLIHINDRLCANITNIGFDAKVAGNVVRFKKALGGHLAYYVSVFYTLLGKITMRAKILIDDVLVHDGETLLCISANGNVYGGGFHVAPKASVLDGLLDFVVVQKVRKIDIAGFVNKYKAGEHEELAHWLKSYRGKKLTIESDSDMTVCIDGEIINAKKCDISIIPSALKCIFPKIV